MIGGAFKRFSNAIQGDDGRGRLHGFMKPIDTVAIAERLNLDQVGASRGAQGLPAASAAQLDGIEQQITQAIESEWTWNGNDLINNLRAYAQRLIEFSVSTELARLDLIAKNTLTRLRDANNRAEAELGPMREHYIACRDELSDFRKRHRLRRTARHKSGRWTTLGLLAVLIGIESAFNGVFFAKGSDFGLLGGVVVAIAISFINVVIAFFLGLFPMRWINHRNLAVKLCGLILSIAGFAVLVGLHGFSAHYRDAMAAVGEDKAMATALQTLKATPYVLADLNSYYLFGLGLLWAFFAVWKGYNFDDPYPRYGAGYRRAAYAREDYSYEHSLLFDDLEEIKEETISALDNGIRAIPLFPQKAGQVRAQRDAYLKQFGAYENAAESAVNQLLARYRDANCAHRSANSPPPAYFDKLWRLPSRFLADANVLAAMAEPVTRQLDAHAAIEELATLSNAVLDEYEKLMIKYPHPTQMPIDGTAT
jgi:hypothetical protein